MRRHFFFWLILGAISLRSPALADDAAPAAAPATDNIIQEFSGGGATTTGLFTVKDRWEVRWNARQVVSVAVMSADGTIVSGAAGVLRGSLFVPLGGQYYLKVTDDSVPPPAPAAPPPPPAPAATNAAPVSSTNAPPAPPTTNASAASTNAAPVPAVTSAPPVGPIPLTDNDTPAPAPDVTWHLQVVQLDTAVSADQALTVYTPFFIVPDSAVTPVAAPVVVPPPVLTDDQAHTVVTIKGDNAQGTGFLLRSPDGTFVVTHTDLLAANPNVKILASDGTAITTLALKCATDRNLAMFAITDNHYAYLPSPPDTLDTLPAGDQVIIPDVGTPADPLLGKPGHIVSANAERIDFNIRMGPGNSGSPVIHVKSGTAIGIVTAQKKVDISDYLAQAWHGNPAPGSAKIIPYYGLRLSGETNWETCDPARFLQETMFLKQFHDNTRSLDSYLNGRRRIGDDNNNISGLPDGQLYTKNSKIMGAFTTYRQLANGADEGQRLDGARELLFDLQGFADTDLATLQDMQKSLYTTNQDWAREELAYRRGLKKEIEYYGNNIVHFDNIARMR